MTRTPYLQEQLRTAEARIEELEAALLDISKRINPDNKPDAVDSLLAWSNAMAALYPDSALPQPAASVEPLQAIVDDASGDVLLASGQDDGPPDGA